MCRLSRVGRVIIISIHQPRYSIYKLFDSLTLVSRGHIVYHGPTANVLNYFSGFGKLCVNVTRFTRRVLYIHAHFQNTHISSPFLIAASVDQQYICVILAKVKWSTCIQASFSSLRVLRWSCHLAVSSF